MKIVIIGGFQMRVGDGAAYWTLKEKLEAHGHQVELREAIGYGMAATPQSCQPTDIAIAEAVIAYSDGFATYKMVEHILDSHNILETPKQVVIGVAGVPDVWFGQVGGLGIWHLDATHAALGVMFNVDDQPNSYGLNTTDQIVQETTIASFSGINDGHSRYNVDCNGLFTGINLPSTKHSGIANHPDVLTAIVKCFM